METKGTVKYNSNDLVGEFDALKKHFIDNDVSVVKAYAVISIMKDVIEKLINPENEKITYTEN